MSALVIYFALTAFVAFVLVLILSAYFKLSFSKKVLLGFVIFLSEIFILPRASNYFAFDIIHGGDRLYSRSHNRNESIKRETFVCDLKLPQSAFEFNDSMSLGIKEAWIEKDWKQGYWYWTTVPGDPEKFNVLIKVAPIKGSWNIKRDKNQEYLGYDEEEKMLIGGIKGLSISDTVKYYVLKRNEFNFDNGNIIGQIKFVLDKK